MNSDFAAQVAEAAGRWDLDPILLASQVTQESAGNTFAMKFEPRYPYLWDVRRDEKFRRLTADERMCIQPPPDFFAMPGVYAETEWIAQKTSWGLLQIMGATARELGYHRMYLSGLLDPVEGLDYACKYLVRLKKTVNGNEEKMLAAYNAGLGNLAGGVRYANAVLQRAGRPIMEA